jgi:asparagine synthase (glutamine-hydrolysing)
MSEIVLNLSRSGWVDGAGLKLRGSLALDDRLASVSEVSRHGQGRLSADLLARLNGTFALAAQSGPVVQAATDRIRSIPLFYATTTDRGYLTDDPYWLLQQLPQQAEDPSARAEFLLAGYVTGPATLASWIKQIQAGELVTLEAASDGIRLSTERYFRYVPTTAEVGAPDRLLQDWDATLLRVFGRLVAGVTPRTIVVPLSGGGDSRTIVWMLRRLGYPHVLCYSYGTLGNPEADRSRSAARRLGVPWLFVEYDRAKWARWYATSERLTYQRFADGFSSIAHLQDWPAVWELRRRGEVPDDAVFVPGHALDFLGGSHIPAHLTRRVPGPRAVGDAIWNAHYQLWRGGPTERLHARRRLAEAVADLPSATIAEVLASVETWDWQERQAKFIANAVRVYEFWGYDWRLPYWDRECVDFWTSVPPSLRRGSRLLAAATTKQLEELGLTLPAPRLQDRMRAVAHKLPGGVRQAAARRLRRTFPRQQYVRHAMGWYGIMPWEVFRKLYSGREEINSFLALERLGRLPTAAKPDRATQDPRR